MQYHFISKIVAISILQKPYITLPWRTLLTTVRTADGQQQKTVDRAPSHGYFNCRILTLYLSTREFDRFAAYFEFIAYLGKIVRHSSLCHL